MSQDTTLQQFIDRHIEIVEPLKREVALAQWEMETAGGDAARERLIALSGQLARVYASAADYDFLMRLPSDGFHDPRLARQHTLLLNRFLVHQMDETVIEEITALEVGIGDLFNNHRATLRGRAVSDNEIDDLLLTSDDAVLRQEAWEASKTVGAVVVEPVLRLVRLRNREARRLGFADYYQMNLTLQEMDGTRLFALLNDLCVRSDTLWAEFKTDHDAGLAARFGIAPEALRPWHYANRFFQELGTGEAGLDRFFADKDLERLTSEFYTAIGLPVDDLLQNSDLYEREGKCQHAFCTDIDRRGDVRVLCNNRPNERWMGTMLHEFGHAVYDKYHDPALPYLLREPAHTMTTEAVALFMGRLTRDAGWLRRYAGVSDAEAARVGELAQQEMRNHLLVFMRWCLVIAHFERALYADPDQDLNRLWWDLVEQYQSLHRPEGRNAPDWAAKIHLATFPVYYHNYQLGEMVASQLLHNLQTVVLAGEEPDTLVTSPRVGDYLRERLFLPGALRPWESWLQNATGEQLNPSHFVRQLQTER